MTMLHWLAGKQPPEGANDYPQPGAEPPETPAPVFAVRAFKQAIFGTPQTAPPKSPRRNSNTEHTRPRPRQVEARPVRPGVPRPKSASDAHALFKDLPDPPSSPSKGILLTPGTARAERKTVTFGESVVDNEGKRPMKSGLPDDCPGKFPSPWSKDEEASNNLVEKNERSRGRSNLTEKLEQVRQESASRPTRNGGPDMGALEDAGDPRTEEGRYWKAQFDVYRENTQREVKKLVLKQKAAKDFARDRDMRCAEMEDQLKVEKEKSAKLERLAAGLEARLKEYETRLSSERTKLDARPARLEAQATNNVMVIAKPVPTDTKADLTAGLNRRMEALRPVRNIEIPTTQHRDPSRSPVRQDILAEGTEQTTEKQRIRSRPENVRPKRQDDNWPQSLASSTTVKGSERPVATSSQQQPVLSPRVPNDATNLPPDVVRKDSAQASPELAAKRVPSPLQGPVIEDRKPFPIRERRSKQATVTTESEELMNSVAFSSAFEENAPVMSPVTTARSPPQAKENIKPATASSAPVSGRRITRNILDKYGNEISEDRVAAARARLLSKGRNVS